MSASTEPTHVVEHSMDDLRSILDRAERGPMTAEERETLWSIIVSYAQVIEEIKDKKATIERLRQIVFGAKTETKPNVKRRTGKAGKGRAGAEPKKETMKKRKGRGRVPADAYVGAERVEVPHGSLRPGDRCPHCEGTVYGRQKPGVFVRVRGGAPFVATVYEQDRLRCGLCGEVFSATLPPEVGKGGKFDETAASMVGLFPASMQWELVRDAARKMEAAWLELVNQAGQGTVLLNDDTPMKILDHFLEQERAKERGEKPKRTGMRTTGVVSELPDGRRVVLYFTGRRHAGENLARVLEERESGLDPPIQMCDGLSHNVPKEIETILSNCLVHARRQFVTVASSFPEEVDHVVEELSLVYENDAKAQGLSAEERLRFHQRNSAPVMKRLKEWMEAQLEEKKVEPNSGLGKAIAYSLKRWEELTLFLREPGAPLDNSLTEPMLKRAILHRKNSLFYKTENGAAVGDLYMSLIATAKLADANPFDYLNELQRHADEVTDDPAAWTPWNYRATLEATAAPAPAGD